jgi:hypothetical protein
MAAYTRLQVRAKFALWGVISYMPKRCTYEKNKKRMQLTSEHTVDCEIGVGPKLNVLIFAPRFADAPVLFCAKSQRRP